MDNQVSALEHFYLCYMTGALVSDDERWNATLWLHQQAQSEEQSY
jgi:hypothetical protein